MLSEIALMALLWEISPETPDDNAPNKLIFFSSALPAETPRKYSFRQTLKRLRL
jgi:hypothetical protein